MSNQLHNELRKEFQLERLVLFSDAVFAIAITLLVIEIKIPDKETLDKLYPNGFSDQNLLNALSHLIPKFIGFLISFLLIGQYWRVHHRLFGYVINFNERLIWLNILFLLFIVLMPFSTGFYSEYVGTRVVTPAIFYTSNLVMLGGINFMMWRYIGNQKNQLTENLAPSIVQYSSLRALLVPFIFIIFTIVYFWSPAIAAWIPISIPLVMRLIFGPMKKKILQQLNQ